MTEYDQDVKPLPFLTCMVALTISALVWVVGGLGIRALFMVLQ